MESKKNHFDKFLRWKKGNRLKKLKYNLRTLVSACWIPRCLGTYTPLLSNGCYCCVLRYLFSRGTSYLDAFSIYRLLRSCSACLLRQPIDQWQRTSVPLVLKSPSFQIPNIPSSYQTNCLTAFWTQLTNPFNGWTPPPLAAISNPFSGKEKGLFLHGQDRMSRHRRSKPRRRSVLNCRALTILESSKTTN